MSLTKSVALIAFVIILAVIRIGAADDPHPGSGDLDAEIDAVLKSDADIETRIFHLHQLERRHADQFSPKLHNELRHSYVTSGQPAEAMRQCELLLSHSVMDTYILSILSEWELDKHRKKAIANLLHSARTAGGCECVQAACWLRVGDLYRDAGASTSAEFYYHTVLTQDPTTASAYHALAEQRLGLTE